MSTSDVTSSLSWDECVRLARSADPRTALADRARVARAVRRLRQAGELPPHVRPCRLAVLRSVTAEVLEPSLVACLAGHGLAGEVAFGQLGNIAREALEDDSFVYREPLDACVVLALAEHVIPGVADPSADVPPEAIAGFVNQVGQLADRFGGLVIACNLALPPRLLAGRLQAQSPRSGRYAVGEANRRLAALAADRANLVVCDIEALAARAGADQFFSDRDLQASMQPFTPAGLALLAGELADLCALYRSAPVKCIVLDCDNTLWGGVVGEDGLDGLQLGEAYPGLCFQQFQRQLVQLTGLGFLLALNSRNNPADVWEVFDRHRGMVLRREHVAAERINWQDKATNMRELAEQLNLGLDSFLFIDDSEFELNLVGGQLPQVRRLAVPPEPWRLTRLLAESGLVDRLAVADEDRGRARMYTHERQRQDLRAQASSVEDYLRGLDIRMTFERFDPAGHLKRAAQLTQKTNQYNLTTRRYTEAELLAGHQAGWRIFLASLSDRFGDYGRIALAIVKPAACGTAAPGCECGTAAPGCAGAPDEPDGRLDVFLLSCRVIGRGVEETFLRLVLAELAGAGWRRLEAEFLPTARNGVCRDFLPNAGFAPLCGEPDGRTTYTYSLDGPSRPGAGADWITLVQETA